MDWASIPNGEEKEVWEYYNKILEDKNNILIKKDVSTLEFIQEYSKLLAGENNQFEEFCEKIR